VRTGRLRYDRQGPVRSGVREHDRLAPAAFGQPTQLGQRHRFALSGPLVLTAAPGEIGAVAFYDQDRFHRDDIASFHFMADMELDRVRRLFELGEYDEETFRLYATGDYSVRSCAGHASSPDVVGAPRRAAQRPRPSCTARRSRAGSVTISAS
jgi:hypothetical protein